MGSSDTRRVAFEAFQAIVESDLGSAKGHRTSSENDAMNASHAMQSRYDTFREEAEALSGGHERMMAEFMELRKVLMGIKDECLEVRDRILAGALVTLEGDEDFVVRYFLIPGGGGKIVNANGVDYVCVNPVTPIGRELIGKQVGDEVSVLTQGQARSLEIVEIL